MKIELVDLLVIVVYFVGITVVGLWSIRRMKMTSDAYFLVAHADNLSMFDPEAFWKCHQGRPSGAVMSMLRTTDCHQLLGSCVTTKSRRSVAMTTFP
jgi:hypothetical protein